MAEITMPKMSDTMEEGRIVRWLKHEGDKVTEGEPIAEIETDKANVEMEAFQPGVITKLLANEGDTVPVGEPIAVIESPVASAAAPAPEAAPVAESGDETPVVPTAQAPEPYAADQVPLVTTPPRPEAEQPAPTAAPQSQSEPEPERIKASPLARRMAEQNGIELSQLAGTGPNGRIVEADIERFLAERRESAAPPPPQPTAPPTAEAPRAQTPPPTPAPPADTSEGEEEELSRMRRTIAERMTKSKQTVPHFYVTSEIDMDRASVVRDELNTDEGAKITFTDLIVKACALALVKFPRFMASYENDRLLLHKEANVGVAVALDEGLIVPVVRDADKRRLREISADVKELVQRAKSSTLLMSEYTGAVFTVSNLGMFDVEEFSAIINPPEAASLAVGSIREIPVISGGRVIAAKRMKVTLSADHRVVDGALAARFLQEIKRRLEAPVTML